MYSCSWRRAVKLHPARDSSLSKRVQFQLIIPACINLDRWDPLPERGVRSYLLLGGWDIIGAYLKMVRALVATAHSLSTYCQSFTQIWPNHGASELRLSSSRSSRYSWQHRGGGAFCPPGADDNFTLLLGRATQHFSFKTFLIFSEHGDFHDSPISSKRNLRSSYMSSHRSQFGIQTGPSRGVVREVHSFGWFGNNDSAWSSGGMILGISSRHRHLCDADELRYSLKDFSRPHVRRDGRSA